MMFKARILEEAFRVGTGGGGKVSTCLGDEQRWVKGMEKGGSLVGALTASSFIYLS